MSTRSRSLRVEVIAAALVAATAASVPAVSFAGTQTISIRGRQQTLHLYGSPQGPPVIVSSGDGGWIHLGPHIAERLAANGYFVVGFDVKAYLESFTTANTTLRPQDEPGDYRTLAGFAARTTGRKPILIGVSEGAGLSILAATDPHTKTAIAGVIGVGLPDFNELAWRWRDALIYVTHTRPNEPGFSTAAIVDKMTPVPLAAIHATHDEFVPLAEVQEVVRRAAEPKKMWIVQASNHRFSDNLAEFDGRLVEAVGWIERNAPR